MTYHQIEFLTHERQAGFLAEAEARRLAKKCTVRRPTFTHRLCAWIGHRLVQWGRVLQDTAGSQPLPLDPHPQPAHP